MSNVAIRRTPSSWSNGSVSDSNGRDMIVVFAAFVALFGGLGNVLLYQDQLRLPVLHKFFGAVSCPHYSVIYNSVTMP